MIKKNEVIRVGPNPKGTAALLEDRYKRVLCFLALMPCAQMPCAGRPTLDIAAGLELLSTHNLDLSQPLCVCWYMCMVLYVCYIHVSVHPHIWRVEDVTCLYHILSYSLEIEPLTLTELEAPNLD